MIKFNNIMSYFHIGTLYVYKCYKGNFFHVEFKTVKYNLYC